MWYMNIRLNSWTGYIYCLEFVFCITNLCHDLHLCLLWGRVKNSVFGYLPSPACPYLWEKSFQVRRCSRRVIIYVFRVNSNLIYVCNRFSKFITTACTMYINSPDYELSCPVWEIERLWIAKDRYASFCAPELWIVSWY